ncbi:MAG: hypothetical protein WBH31_15260 [Promethearchaeia archaeon]
MEAETKRNVGIILLIVGMPFIFFGVLILVRYLGSLPIGWGSFFLGICELFLGIGGFLIITGLFLLLASRSKSKKITKNTFLKTFPYICTKCGTFSHMEREYCENCGEKDSYRETLSQDYGQYSEKLKEKEEKEFLPKVARKQKELEEKLIGEKEEGIRTKMEAAPNVAYMLRIEKEVGDSGVERINYICGYCGLKNNLKTIDEEHGIFQCLNCGAENHLLK